MHGETAKQIIRWHFHSVFLRQWFSWKGGKRSCRSLVLLNVSTSPEFIFWSRQRTYIHRFKPEQITKNKRKLLIFLLKCWRGSPGTRTIRRNVAPAFSDNFFVYEQNDCHANYENLHANTRSFRPRENEIVRNFFIECYQREPCLLTQIIY